nr:hypothetical protein OG546_10665 [Streptomyces antimycoticus]
MLHEGQLGPEPGIGKVPGDDSRVGLELFVPLEGLGEQRVVDRGRQHRHQQPTAGRQQLGQARERGGRVGDVVHRFLQPHRVQPFIRQGHRLVRDLLGRGAER